MQDPTFTTQELTVYYAVWCPHCHSLFAVTEGIEQEYPDLSIKRVNIETEREQADAAGIRTVPTAVLRKDGQELGRFSGFRNRQNLVAFLDEHLH